MSEDLKRCPFCGGEPEMTHAVMKEYYNVDPEVICKSCGYSIKAKDLAINIAYSPEANCAFLDNQAISVWNTRPEEDRLKEALEQIAILRKINPNVRATSFSSCAEDGFCNLYCTMGDIAIKALSNAPDMNDGRITEINGEKKGKSVR